MLDCGIIKLVSVGDICNVSRGASPRPIKKYLTQSGEGVPWIKIGDVSPFDKYIKKTNERITQEGAKKSRFLHKGDLILSNSMSFGRPYILEIDGCIHDGWISLSGFENYVLRDFLYEVLNTKCVQDYWAMKANNGGAMSNLNSDIVKSTIIKIPSLNVQEEIVKILDSFTNLIDALNEELSLRQKQFEYYREKLLTFDDNVYLMSLGDCCVIKGRIGFRGYTIKDQVNKGEGAISLSPGNISEGIINYNQCTYISWDKYYESPEIMINNGDIIFCKTASVGKVAVINDLPCEATINPQLVVLKEININKKYLYYYLSSNSIQNKVKSLAGVGSVPNISQSILNDLDISVPSSQVMKSIVEKLDAFESLISSLKEEIALRQKQYEYYREKLLTFD